MIEQPVHEDSEDEELLLPETREGRSRYYSQCQRRYPRLFPHLFWIYLVLEGLCFVTDVAFLSSTIMAAHTNHLYSNSTSDGSSSSGTGFLRGRLLEDDDDDDDDWLVQSAFKLNHKEKTQDDFIWNFNWNSFQDYWIFQQLHTQWLQQQEFMVQWILGMEEGKEANTETSSIPS